MAGSYNHMINRNGRLLGNAKFTGMIENLGDAYEAAEECFGMIWYLARQVEELAAVIDEREADRSRGACLGIIEMARLHYEDGLKLGGYSGGKRVNE